MKRITWKALVTHIHNVESEKDLTALFTVLFTLAERQELVKRMSILKALLQGKLTQREIAKECAVSIANVSRGSNVLKVHANKVKKIIL